MKTLFSKSNKEFHHTLRSLNLKSIGTQIIFIYGGIKNILFEIINKKVNVPKHESDLPINRKPHYHQKIH